jgi:hypothetical protein
MRRIAQIITAALAALGALTWEFVNGSWRLIRSLVVPQPPHVDPAAAPVSQAQAAAEQILAANDAAKAERAKGHDGMTHRYPLGYAVAMAARGVEGHLVDVPGAVAAWALALTPQEKAAIAKFTPDQIEAHLNTQRRLPGVPAFGTKPEEAVAVFRHNLAEPEPEVVEPIFRGLRFA